MIVKKTKSKEILEENSVYEETIEMMKTDIYKKIAVNTFNVGLIFLIIDIAKDFLSLWVNSNLLNFIPFSAIGLIICLISLPFLLVEWMILPLGTRSKRVNLYQGAGNIFALMMLVGGWLWRGNSLLNPDLNINEVASMTFSSGGLFMAVIFVWLGGQIAASVSKKTIHIEEHIKKLAGVQSGTSASRMTTTLIKGVSRTPATQN